MKIPKAVFKFSLLLMTIDALGTEYCSSNIALGVSGGSASLKPDGTVTISGLHSLAPKYQNYVGTWVGDNLIISVNQNGSIRVTRLAFATNDCVGEIKLDFSITSEISTILTYQIRNNHEEKSKIYPKRQIISLTHPIQFTDKGYKYLSIEIPIQSKPHLVNGEWEMTLNGIRLKKSQRSKSEVENDLLENEKVFLNEPA